jgi:regulator of PEP synthase PpsR (kinase-PPPase family)
VQNIPVVSVIVAPERQAAARNRRRENLKSGSFSCPSTRQRKEMEVANAKQILAAEGSIVHVHDYQQVVEEFSVF